MDVVGSAGLRLASSLGLAKQGAFGSNGSVTLRRLLVGIAPLPAVIWLAGCGRAPVSAPAAGHALPEPPFVASCAPGTPGGQLVLAITNPLCFNPVLVTDPASDTVTRMLFSPLVNMDLVTEQPQPALAESWTVDADQKTWTFKLRKGLRWSDGEPLTADDVVFTWNSVLYDRALSPVTCAMYQLNGANVAVTKVDDLTVRMAAPAVFAPFLEYFGSQPYILPKHIFEPAIAAKRFASLYRPDSLPSSVVGSGPFRMKEIRPWKYVVLERNPEFWMTDNRGQRLPYFDEVKFVVADDAAAVESMFLKGKSDAFDVVRPSDYERFKAASAGGRFRLVEIGPGTESDFLWFNQNTGADTAGRPFVNPAKLKWFRDKKFRQAVSCAIDRDRIVREVYGGRAQPVYGLVSEQDHKWFDTNVSYYTYNPPRARALLAEIGMRDRSGSGVLTDSAGNPVEFTLYANEDNVIRSNAARLVQEDLGKVGIRVNRQLVDYRLLLTMVNRTFNYECAWMGLGGGVSDPVAEADVLRSGADLHQWFPNQRRPSTDWEARIDALMDQVGQTLDFPTRKKCFDEIQAIWADEVPMIGTATWFAYGAIRPDIGNVRPSAISPYRMTWNVPELYFTKK